MKWTTTQKAAWRRECERLWQDDEGFELRDLSQPQDEIYCSLFAMAHGLEVEKSGDTAFFRRAKAADKRN